MGEYANRTTTATNTRPVSTSCGAIAVVIWNIKHAPILNAATAQNRVSTTDFIFRPFDHYQVVAPIDAVVVEASAVIRNA